MSINGIFPPGLIVTYAVIMLIAIVVVHIGFAVAVASDTVKAVMVPRWLWAVATLLGGPIVGSLYWIAHHGVPTALAAQPDAQRP